MAAEAQLLDQQMGLSRDFLIPASLANRKNPGR